MGRLLGGVLIAAVLALAPATASAATVTGGISFTGALGTSTCSIVLGGTGLGPVSLTSGTATCSPAAITLTFSPNWTLTIGATTFTMTNVIITTTESIVGTCTYRGGLSGSAGGGGLVITGDTLVKQSGGSLCTSNPSVAGGLSVTL